MGPTLGAGVAGSPPLAAHQPAATMPPSDLAPATAMNPAELSDAESGEVVPGHGVDPQNLTAEGPSNSSPAGRSDPATAGAEPTLRHPGGSKQRRGDRSRWGDLVPGADAGREGSTGARERRHHGHRKEHRRRESRRSSERFREHEEPRRRKRRRRSRIDTSSDEDSDAARDRRRHRCARSRSISRPLDEAQGSGASGLAAPISRAPDALRAQVRAMLQSVQPS